MELNHAEALQLAYIKAAESNLARCYIANRDEIERLRDALIPFANAGFPAERACLTDEDVARAQAALYGV